VLYLGWEAVRLWRLGDRPRAELLGAVVAASARAFLVLNLVVLTWVLEWYFLWPLALTTLLGWRRTLTKLTVAYTLTSLPAFYVHHYWSNSTPATVVLVYALPPLLVPAVDWAYRHLWRRSRRGFEVVPILAPSAASVRSEPSLTLE
jgi:hypothetical protein